jgi:predicted amidohydrolase YtcJ
MRNTRGQAPAVLLAGLISVALTAPALANDGVTLLSAARIHTMDPAQPQAGAMAYDHDGTIVAVGTREDLLARYPAATQIDAGNATVIPGLIDAHGHVAGLGQSQMQADLVGAGSKEEVLRRLRAFAADLPDGAWLLGRGWDQNDWPERTFPTAADLDAAFPRRPVWLTRIDGHAGWANSAAIAAAEAAGGRDLSSDWQPDGGRIVRGANGQPSGIFVDAAMAQVDSAMPGTDAEAAERALAVGMQLAVEHGLTGVHDAGVSLQQLRAYQALADRGEMPLRVYAMADGDGEALAWLCSNGPYEHPDGRLQMRAVKLYVDGALGSRGAALIEDYSDDAGNDGLLLMTPDQLVDTAARAKGCGVQVATHAIGDRGNRVVLDAFEQVLGRDAGTDHRWRVEHAQILTAADIPRVAALGVVASMQPTHATSDMPWAADRVGPDRIQWAYAWRKLRDAGARLALGSDFPVESVDPRLGLHAAVTRSNAQEAPAGGWMPQEKLTAWEAMRGFTRDAAHAGFDEDHVGSLAVGRRADFVLLAQDPLAVEPRQLDELEVLATYVDGEAVYRRP